jgi:raffinose/stachyose/melibiose transport system substrate-binding protein
MLVGVVAFGTGGALAEDAPLLVWVAGALVSSADQKLPQEEWVINKLARAFEAENLGVRVEIAFFSDQIAMTQMFKATASGEDAPDIVNVWAGQQLFELKDILVDIKDMVPQEDRDNILGWDIMSLDFKEGGPVLGYPASGNEVCGFFYNRQVLAACGLDYDANPPKTVAALMADMKKIKDAGYLPLAAGDNGWGQALFTAYASWWVQVSGSERVASNSQGITKFAEDEGFLKAMQAAVDMYNEGYINVDYATIPNELELFLEGNAALLATGNWNTDDAVTTLGEENVGFLMPPDIEENAPVKGTCIGGPGQVLAISKTCKDPDTALRFLSFLSNKENMAQIIRSQSKLTLRRDISAEDLGIGDAGIMRQEFDAALKYVFWADNSMVPDVNAQVQKLSPLALTGKMTVAEFAAELDKTAAEAAAQ